MYSKTSSFTFNLSFFLAILGLLGIFAYAGIGFNALIESNEQVRHTLIVLNKLDETLAYIADAESGVRGYIITGDETFLDPYHVTLDSQEGVNAVLAELRQLTADNLSQQVRLDRLEELVNNKLVMFNRNIEIRRQEGFDAAQESVASQNGKEEMDAIRALIEEMQEDEFALLQTRSESASKNLQNLLWISAVGVPFMLALMTACYFLLLRQIRDRHKAEDDLRQLNAELDRRVIERTAELADSERKYVLLFGKSSVPSALFQMPDGVVVDVNEAFEKLVGYSKQEMLGKTMMELGIRQPADPAEAKARFERQGGLVGHETAINTRSGEERVIVSNIFPLEFGGHRYAITTALDITERKQAEEEVKRLATYNKLVLESVGEGIYGIDTNGIITFVNPAAARLFGEPRENLIGIPAHDHHHHTRANGTPYPREECPIYAAFHDGTTHHVDDEVFWRADGSSFPVEYTSTPFRNENGEITGAVVVFKDITERKRAEEQNRFFTDLVASTSDAIIVVDMQQNIQSWNRGAESIYGWKQTEVLGRPAKDILDTDFLEITRETVTRQILEKGYWNGEVKQLRRDGARIPVQSSISLNKDAQGSPIGIVAVNRDITAYKQAEEERLAREVAERASQAKSEFLSRMSHEFRTPLNAILGFAQLLQMDQLPPAQARGVEQIYKAGRHLLDLVNEVLDLARIESGRMTISPEPVRVTDAVNETFDLIRPMVEEHGLSLMFKIPSSSDVFVEADRQRFKQVLLNLLSNAVKYNREGGAIEVTASLTISGYLRLHVRDTGAGIPPEKMERLFVPFDRLDTDAAEGTGLGLALSKGLIEAMGGRIGAESRVGEGSIFWIELKLVTDRLKEVIMAEVEENLTENMRKRRGIVLYVEDNLANVNLIEAIMERIPAVKLISAMQGRLALDLAKEHQPDLILLDLHLPDMHGTEVLRRLKAEPATQNIPVVIISADAMPSHVEQLLAQGANGYLTKPIDVKEFLKVIEEHM